MSLTGCGGESYVPTVFPPLPPEPSSNATAAAPSKFTSTPTGIRPTEPPSTPTFTPFPIYHNKGVVFNYLVSGNQADWDSFFDPPSGNIVTRLVLYDDGQLLIAGVDETYKQKILSPTEINSFLLKLEALGFYSLESNQQHDQTDRLYNFGNNYQESAGGLRYCVSMNTDKSRTLCVREPYTQFLIPKMKDILQYLDEYQPAGMTPYYPDRILVDIQSDTDPSVANPPAISWDEHFPSLEYDPNRFTSGTSNQVVFIDGAMAREIHLFFEGEDMKVVTQNGEEYVVWIRVLLPHEKVKNPQQ